MLACLDPDMPRHDWVVVGMAIKAEFGDDGFDAWDRWSERGATYKAADAKTAWRGFGVDGGVSFGTLVHLAQQAGWQPRAVELSAEERQRREAEAAERRRQAAEQAAAQEAEAAEWQERIAQFAERLWAQLAPSAARVPYLGAKRVGAHGVRFARQGLLAVTDLEARQCSIVRGRQAISEWFESGAKDLPHISFRYLKAGTMVVPMVDIDGKLWGLQLIFESGAKTFFKHGRKSGCFHVLGAIQPGLPIALVEGYATGASVFEATGWPVVVTFDAGNLERVAGLMRNRYPDAQLVLCGDDDHEAVNNKGEPINPGRIYASRAAGRVRGITAFPSFADSTDRKDWNDLHVEQGLEAVRAQLQAALAASAPAEPPPAPEAEPGGGAGTGGASPPRSGSAAGGGGEPTDRSGPEWAWMDLLVRTDKGGLRATLHNVVTILDNDPAWAGLYRLDAFAAQIYRTREAPWGAEPGPLTDVDGGEIAAWLGHPHNYGLSVKSGMALEAVEVLATRRQFHPVRDYLDRLQWDGIERLPHLMWMVFGAARNEYTAAVGKNLMISAVARVRQPGCKVDTMVILEGDQGAGKSSAVRALAGPEWFSEMLESPQHKDFYQNLQGRWIIEIPELQAFNKADRNKIKAAISAQEDTYRPSYGRYARQFKRQCIFVGTTNDDAYLKDETGARRFLPVRCGTIDLEVLHELRDQLWAEADARFKRGESWWEFPPDAAREQDARYDADAWEDPIVHWLDGHARAEDYKDHPYTPHPDRPVEETTISEVMEHALGIEVAKHSRPDQMRVGAILRRLGWRRKQKTYQGRVRYVYVRPAVGKVAA